MRVPITTVEVSVTVRYLDEKGKLIGEATSNDSTNPSVYGGTRDENLHSASSKALDLIKETGTRANVGAVAAVPEGAY